MSTRLQPDRQSPEHPRRELKTWPRGDVRIAATLACEECKRRNYQTNKSKRNNPTAPAAQVLAAGASATPLTARPASRPEQAWLAIANRARDRRARSGLISAGARNRASERGRGESEPLEHATPDVELAEAQLALGRLSSPDAGDARGGRGGVRGGWRNRARAGRRRRSSGGARNAPATG